MDDVKTFSNRHIDLAQRDTETLLAWRVEPRVVLESGQGCVVTDVDGNNYYDMNAGMMCMVLGHSHAEITEVIREQAGKLVHETSWFSNPWVVELGELIASTLPGDLKVVNFCVTGSEAVEIGMRMAIGVTGKYDLVSVIRGLHGGSLGVESMTTIGGARRRNLGPLMIPAKSAAILPPFCYRCPINLEYPSCDIRCLKASQEMIECVTSSEVAAVMAETMMVAGGMIVPPDEWLPRLRALADQHEALLLLDEAQFAPAKTGKMWAFEHYDVVPDIVTFAKGMSAGFAICGTVTTPEIAEAARTKAGVPWGGTYSGDPLTSAVALKSLQIVLRDNLTERAETLGGMLRAKLDLLRDKHDCVGDVRGKGLYQMLDIVKDKDSREPDFLMAERIRYNAVQQGVLLICIQNFIRISPPLIITEAEIDDFAGRLEAAITRALDGHPRDLDLSKPTHSLMAVPDNA